MADAGRTPNVQFNWLLLFFVIALAAGAIVRRSLIAGGAPFWLAVPGSICVGALCLLPLRRLAPTFALQRHFLVSVVAIAVLSAAVVWAAS